MMKKINEDGVLIKKMIDKGYKPKYITKNKKLVIGKILP